MGYAAVQVQTIIHNPQPVSIVHIIFLLIYGALGGGEWCVQFAPCGATKNHRTFIQPSMGVGAESENQETRVQVVPNSWVEDTGT